MSDVEIYNKSEHDDQITYGNTKTLVTCSKCGTLLVVPKGKYSYMADTLTCPKCGELFLYSN